MNPDLRDKLLKYLDQDEVFRQVYDYTRQRFQKATHLTAHNWEHAYRDTINAVQIGEAEGADMAVVLPAIVMHDIGFLYGATGKTHASTGAEKLEEYLEDGNITLSAELANQIRACISTHKGSMHGEVPESLEAKVVSDADLLEKFGPVGVYQSIRAFTEFNYDAKRILHNLAVMDGWAFATKTGQELADTRSQFSIDFAAKLNASYQPYLESQT